MNTKRNKSEQRRSHAEAFSKGANPTEEAAPTEYTKDEPFGQIALIFILKKKKKNKRKTFEYFPKFVKHNIG